MVASRRHARTTVMTLVAASVLALAACGGASAQYVANSDEGFFLKFPKSWERFDIEESQRPDDATTDAWQVFLDANDDPTVDHLESVDQDQPVALVEIRSLLPAQREQVSLGYLRSLVLAGQADPLSLVSNGDPNIELVSYEELTEADGHWGSWIVVTVNAASGGEPVTIGHQVMVDPDLSTLYRLQVACRASCYDEHRQEIDRVFSSWTIEEHS
jgi:hypothetical protein